MVSTNMNSKQKILNEAKNLFHIYGIEKTSVDSILKESNVTKSNFYYHFKSKDQLALQVITNWINEHSKETITPTLDNKELNPRERLEKFYERIINYHESMNCERGCPFGNTALELSDIKEEFRVLLSKYFVTWTQKIENCIREGIEQNQFKSEIDPSITAELILSHLEGAVMLVKTHKKIDTLKNGSKALLKLIVKDNFSRRQ